MDSPNRINQTSITPTVGRQSPKHEFGELLAKSVGEAVRVGGALASGLTSGNPILSAAVSGLASVASSGLVAAGATSVGGTAAMPSETRSGEGFELLKLQDQQSKQYLALQSEMQRESREYNTISNVMKVRHDSAKAAINNVR